jgi:membrane-associated phospholipid phosphatase
MRPQTSDRSGNALPVLDARRGDLPSRLAASLRGQHPAIVFAATAALGYLLLAGLTIALGVLLVDELLPVHGLSAEERLNTWLAEHRSSSLDAASAVGSAIGDVPAIPVLVLATALTMLWRRRFRVVAFIVGAILIEVATYRVASLVIHRERPQVVRLDDLPLNQSFPSGHVAASVVVYAGLALLVTSHCRRRWVSVVCWTLAVALPALVALSRMYRGMHHLTDVSAGLLMGVGALLVALIATRACGRAARDRPAAAPVPRMGART